MRGIVLALFLLALPAVAEKKPVSDDRLYDEVRMKLANDPDVKGGNLEVEVHGGVVTLKGQVRTAKQRSKAQKLTRKVRGVTEVNNQLSVTP